MVDPSEETTPQRVNYEKKPRVDGETPTSISAALSAVLDCDDLLIEILLRVGFPTALVCAAAVCRRWLRHASDPSFLRRFRKLHPPRLLGFYVNHHEASQVTPSFVPMLPQAPEFTAIVHRASSILDTDQSNGESKCVLDCHNGSVMIVHRGDGSSNRTTFRAHNLLFPERGLPNIIPSGLAQVPSSYSLALGEVLSKEEEGFGLSYLCVVMYRTVERKQTVHVYTLQDGVMCLRCSAIDQIPYLQPRKKSVLVGNKIYIAAAQLDIFVLDLVSSTFSTIQLPQGVEHGRRNTMMSRSDDSDGVYLAHVKGLRLSMWLHKLGDWLLVDTICLREVCTSLSMLDYSDSLIINHVGDNGEFVFLEMGRCVLFWDVKRKTVHKVYELENEDHSFGYINSFMMIWPPTFPMFKDDLARTEMPVEE